MTAGENYRYNSFGGSIESNLNETSFDIALSAPSCSDSLLLTKWPEITQG